jgi:alpha-1,2-mannosyltransferase
MSLPSMRDGIVAQAAPAKTPADELYAKWTVGAATFFIMLEIAYLAIAGLPPTLRPWVDHTHFVLGRDFLNTWVGARSVFDGGPAPWFDAQAYNAALRQLLGAAYPEHYWSYPPHVLLFTWPFGLLPYLPSYIVWCAIGIALYLLACSRAIRSDRLLFLAVAPGVAVCIFFGQNGFYTAALLIGGLLCLDRRPVLAGVLFGILTIKPQLGLLLPVVLLLERRWLTIVVALATAACLVAATALLFGPDVWLAFWHKVIPQQQWLTAHGDGLLLVMVASVFYGARLLHLPEGLAWAMQGLVAALAVGAVVWAFWKRRDRVLALSLLIAATFLVTPYILNYDMVVLGFAVALLRERNDNTTADHWLLIAVWTLPVTMMLAGAAFIPLAPMVLIAFVCRLIWRLAHAEANVAKPAPGVAAAVAA